MAVTVWILGDQLLQNHPALEFAVEETDRDQVVVLMIESEERAQRYPYQLKKLVLLFSAMRHYAESLRSSGYQVDYRISESTTRAIEDHLAVHKPDALLTMAASEFGGRSYQQYISRLFDTPITILTNKQFLIGQFNPIPKPQPGKRYVQEQFYRKMRRHFDLLMEANGEPTGGRWNFDKENRQRLPKDVQPANPISFKSDDLTQQVMVEVDQKFRGVGVVTGFDLAVTHKQAELAALDFFDHRLADFGRYEDAMSAAFETINHSRLSPYLNIGLLEPLSLAREAQKRFENGHAPINSVEGFIRQLVGWREYIYWQYWRLMPGISNSNYWNAERPLPEFFWNGDTDLNCLHHVIKRALQNGYTHHIERLMIISNYCLLTGVDPSDVNEWFLSVYIDAYEWVMLPNVYGMGLHADGGQIGTKPYIASANYINKMSDYCQNCTYDRKLRTGEQACPFNYLYWNFILDHEERLRSNPRMGTSLLGLRHLDWDERLQVQHQAERFLNMRS